MKIAGSSGRLVLVLVVGGAAVAAALVAVARDPGLAGGPVMAPYFEVDPLWPKPLPNHWVIGAAVGVWVDERDHVWMLHRPSSLSDMERGLDLTPPTGECCAAAPHVLEFDPAGTLVGSWGGPGDGYEWPSSGHGLTVDHNGNVWIGGNGDGDAQVLKFTRDGRFLMQVGAPDVHRTANADGAAVYTADSHDRRNFGRAAKIFVDPRTNEAYVADGYLNHRVAVLDADTGELKRYWGAYGNKPDDTPLGPYEPGAEPAQQFRNPVHCADLSNDDLLYVCDRVNNRLQVFRPDGTFVTETFIGKNSLGEGAVWDVAFSPDPEQTYLYVADGRNMKIHVLLRETLEELTAFGDGGRQPGQFYGVHNIATDSQGNLYTTETYEGKRLQKFIYRGIREVGRQQGVVWPQR